MQQNQKKKEFCNDSVDSLTNDKSDKKPSKTALSSFKSSIQHDLNVSNSKKRNSISSTNRLFGVSAGKKHFSRFTIKSEKPNNNKIQLENQSEKSKPISYIKKPYNNRFKFFKKISSDMLDNPIRNSHNLFTGSSPLLYFAAQKHYHQQNLSISTTNLSNNFENKILNQNDTLIPGHRSISVARCSVPHAGSSGILCPNLHHQRRESFIYKSDSEFDVSIRSSRNQSLTGNCEDVGQSEEMIVTPFAQILSTLRKIRLNLIHLTSIKSKKDDRFGPIQSNNSHILHSGSASPLSNQQNNIPQHLTASIRIPTLDPDLHHNELADETLEELEWCLKQLENLQTKRSVSNLANLKFKKLLSRELNNIAELGHDDNAIRDQISNFIVRTFMDDENNEDIIDAKEQHRLLKNKEDYAGETNNENTKIPNKERSNPQISHKSKDSNSETFHNCPTVSVSLNEAANAASEEINSKQYNVIKTGEDNKVNIMSEVNNTKDTATFNEKTSIRISATKNEDTLKNCIILKNKIISAPENKSDEFRKLINVVAKTLPQQIEIDELQKLLDNEVSTWHLSIFQIASLSVQHPLRIVTLKVFQERGLFREFNISQTTLNNYMLSLESTYRNQLPYHNSTHAADVIQSTHFLLCESMIKQAFSGLEILSVLFAAAIHDVDHPGLTNQYLINTGNQLAIIYNDISVLENHHLAVAFHLLRQSDCNIFVNFSKKQMLNLRKIVIDLVLATDMSKHMTLLADLKTMVESKKISSSGLIKIENYSDRILILQNLIHCSDISSPTKPLPLYKNWVKRIMREFFLQGDKEREEGLEISPMCDRQTANIEKSQLSFIDFIVLPLYETWAELVCPEKPVMLETLQENRDWLLDLLDNEEKYFNIDELIDES